MISPMQGVGDLYTDPQIHTSLGTEYGDGNLGVRGMALFFLSHVCNSVCEALGLAPFELHDNELQKLKREELNYRKFDKAIKKEVGIERNSYI